MFLLVKMNENFICGLITPDYPKTILYLPNHWP